MATEEAVIVSRGKGVARSHRRNPRADTPSPEITHKKPSDIQQFMYQTLLGTDKKLWRKPIKYNVGEIDLHSPNSFNTHEYDGHIIQTLEEAQRRGTVEFGVPYVAQGMLDFDNGQAILQTATTDINLGPVGSHAGRLFDTLLKGYDVAVPIIFDPIAEDEVQMRLGETATYLIPNPDRPTTRRLRRKGAEAVIKGQVRKLDAEEAGTMTVRTTDPGYLFDGKKTTVIIDGHPVLDRGARERPTGGEPVGVYDQVLVPVRFEKDGTYLARDPRLLAFSKHHETSFAAQQQALEQGLNLFDTLLSDDTLQTVTAPNGKPFDVSTPDKKAAVMRYLYAELHAKWDLLTAPQQERLLNSVFALDQNVRPMMFEDGDPMRAAFDNYFREIDEPGEMPRLAEAMTPQQILDEMLFMSAYDNYPLSLDSLISFIERYPGQFESETAVRLIDTVFEAREQQLRSGTDPDAAVYSLLEVLPYLQQKDVRYQADFLAHIIHSGIILAGNDHDQDSTQNSHNLYELLRQSFTRLDAIAYPNNDYFSPNHEVLRTLLRFYPEYIRFWPENLPEQVERTTGSYYLLRDLALMSGDPEGEQQEQVEQTDVDDFFVHVPDADVLDRVASGLRGI